MVGGGVDDGRVRHGDECQHHGGADHDAGRHAEKIDQRGHQQEAAADAHDGADEADEESDGPDRDDRDIDLRGLEPHLQRQPVDPHVAPRAADFGRASLACAQDRPHAFHDHHAADDAEQRQVRDRDRQIELAQPAQQREQPDAGGGADQAADQQHSGKRRIERAPAPVIDRAREGRRRHVARHARDRDRRADADEDQQRRHQKPAADAEHARDESDREPHEQDEQDIDGQFGDRKVDLHETGSADARVLALKPWPSGARPNREETQLSRILRPSRRKIRAALLKVL
jgi:hypothetical protein